MSFLSIEAVSCGYSGLTVIKDLSFLLEAGSFTSIIGPNGSGKTTILRAMSRTIKPDYGSIHLDGRNLSAYKETDLAKKLAVVSQNLDAIPLRAFDYVLLGRYPYRQGISFFENKTDMEAAEKYMGLTDTIHLKDKTLSELSGGERQLLQIARALTQEPRLILLDEPTAHLDIRHQVEVLDLVRRLNRDLGITVVTVLHDLNLASEYSDKILLLKDGSIFQSGTPEAVLTYSNIEAVYGTVVIVQKNPLSGKPFVVLVSEEIKKMGKGF